MWVRELNRHYNAWFERVLCWGQSTLPAALVRGTWGAMIWKKKRKRFSITHEQVPTHTHRERERERRRRRRECVKQERKSCQGPTAGAQVHCLVASCPLLLPWTSIFRMLFSWASGDWLTVKNAPHFNLEEWEVPNGKGHLLIWLCAPPTPASTKGLD